MKIIYCGYGNAARECLLQLMLNQEISCNDVLVYTYNTEDNKYFLDILTGMNIEYSFKSVNEDIEMLKQFKPEMLISVYYRDILNEEVLKIMNYKAFNLHPSLLPAYKGCFSSVWAILNGEVQTGITFHYIDKGIDTGRVILQCKLNIEPEETAYSLYHKLIALFVSKFNEVFKLVKEEYLGVEQVDNTGCYYPRKLPFNGELDSQTSSFDFAKRFIKAMHFPPFPGAKIIIDEKLIEFGDVEELEKYRQKFKKE